MSYTMPAWSYSSLTSFETCPYRYYMSKVKKEFPEQQTEATLWGNRVHKSLENAVATGSPLGAGMEQWQPIADKFRKRFVDGARVLVEQKMAINKWYYPVEWGAEDAWCRGIADITVLGDELAVSCDWKTGKRKTDTQQMKLMAGMIFAHHPQIKYVHTAFVWLKEGTTDKDKFEAEKKGEIWNEFIPRVAKMESAYTEDKWPKKPSGLCRGWCPVKSCTYWEPKRV